MYDKVETIIGAGLVAANALAVVVDPVWSIPLNTFLLIVLALVNKKQSTKLERVERKVTETLGLANDHATAMGISRDK